MNITALSNFKSLNLGVKVLLTLFSLADENGRIRTNKDALARYFKVDRRTVGNHINALAHANIIKFKYSGQVFINPAFYYVGAPHRRELVVEEYKNFKSDVI